MQPLHWQSIFNRKKDDIHNSCSYRRLNVTGTHWFSLLRKTFNNFLRQGRIWSVAKLRFYRSNSRLLFCLSLTLMHLFLALGFKKKLEKFSTFLLESLKPLYHGGYELDKRHHWGSPTMLSSSPFKDCTSILSLARHWRKWKRKFTIQHSITFVSSIKNCI